MTNGRELSQVDQLDPEEDLSSLSNAELYLREHLVFRMGDTVFIKDSKMLIDPFLSEKRYTPSDMQQWRIEREKLHGILNSYRSSLRNEIGRRMGLSGEQMHDLRDKSFETSISFKT